ncbi:MAG: hypothetical protein QOK00_2354 [Thermoleophilaceae bacterium]|jgi:sugar diacid utilization regulator|nr:hypothetical protein [Thermoleophilaceae bacterium]
MAGGALAAEQLTASGSQRRLQDIVDEAGLALGRPVAIDDRQLRLLAYTQHQRDEVDEVRLASVLRQPFQREVIQWFRDHGVGTSSGPVAVSGSEELGLLPRVCIPIDCYEHLLGHMWLIDADGTLTADDIERAAAFGREAAIVLYRELLLRDLDRAAEREFLRDVLSQDGEVREHALAQAGQLGLITPDGPFAVLALRITDPCATISPEAKQLALDTALARIRRQLAPKHGLHLLRPGHALLLVSLAEPKLRSQGIRSFAELLQSELQGTLAASGDHVGVVSVGGSAKSLVEAVISYRQAVRALDVAEAVSSFGHVVEWDDLGIYRLLVNLPLDQLGATELHAGLQALVDDPRHHSLVATLESFLDNAGDVQATAAALYVHRTSLWHRLRRIEELAGVNLNRGEDRLMLHLGLKLARLRGETWRACEQPGALDVEGTGRASV